MNERQQVMPRREYQAMYEAENNYWWYQGLRDFMEQALNWADSDGKPLAEQKALDAGCGTGANLEMLHAKFDWVAGFDFSWDAVLFCRERELPYFQCASITEIPYQSESFDWVFSMDVLTVLKKEERKKALKEIIRVLKPGGYFLFNLAAYEFLKSEHDLATHTQERFTKRKILSELTEVGFRSLRVTYRNTILFPPLAAVRLLKKIRASRKSEAELKSDFIALPAWLNRFLARILKLENRLLNQISFPFGLSVCGIAQKEGR